jgi:hypothetical protein
MSLTRPATRLKAVAAASTPVARVICRCSFAIHFPVNKDYFHLIQPWPDVTTLNYARFFK